MPAQPAASRPRPEGRGAEQEGGTAVVSLGRLSAIVFVVGAASLATEISASRLVAPYFGSSTIVWANVIGLVLVYLSVGYWLGGRYADRNPTPRALGRILLVAAVALAILPFLSRPVLRLAIDAFTSVNVGVTVGSFLATLILFSVPVTLLGMVSPCALRLGVTGVDNAGSVSGRLSSIGTAGAIVGTFAPAVVTIPLVGTERTLVGAAVLVAGAAVPLLLRPAGIGAAAAVALLAVPPGAIKPVQGLIEERDTRYGYAAVIREQDHLVLRTDEGVADQSVYRAGTALTGGEWDMPLIVPPLLGRPLRRVLVIGNGAGTTARALAAVYPGISVDGVEIDPELTSLGRAYMGEDAIPGLTVITSDGRTYLETTSARYDLVVVDAYHSAYVPFHLATQEFFSLVKDHLEAGGAVALNVARVPDDDALPRAIAGTLATVMPHAFRWRALRYNELVFAVDGPLGLEGIRSGMGRLPAVVASLGPLVSAQAVAVDAASDPLTDDRAPVEWITDRAVLDYVAHGGRFDEHLLPTAP